MEKLYRSEKNRILGGVCGGLGTYLDIDPNIIRILWILFCFLYGTGILVYIIAWLILPNESEKNVIDADYTIKE
jgi:phage shock protein PspC (stress-responsive transcriptional regulator)